MFSHEETFPKTFVSCRQLDVCFVLSMNSRKHHSGQRDLLRIGIKSFVDLSAVDLMIQLEVNLKSEGLYILKPLSRARCASLK